MEAVHRGCWFISVCLQKGAWCVSCRCWEMQWSMSVACHRAALTGRCQPYASSTHPPSSVSLPWKLSPQRAQTPTTLKSSSLVVLTVFSVHWKSDCCCYDSVWWYLCVIQRRTWAAGIWISQVSEVRTVLFNGNSKWTGEEQQFLGQTVFHS